jgi:hypothetical protein
MGYFERASGAEEVLWMILCFCAGVLVLSLNVGFCKLHSLCLGVHNGVLRRRRASLHIKTPPLAFPNHSVFSKTNNPSNLTALFLSLPSLFIPFLQKLLCFFPRFRTIAVQLRFDKLDYPCFVLALLEVSLESFYGAGFDKILVPLHRIVNV